MTYLPCKHCGEIMQGIVSYKVMRNKTWRNKYLCYDCIILMHLHARICIESKEKRDKFNELVRIFVCGK